ncbi:MAG: hypothetical protein HLUCCA11_05150 [Phormidesmis priestleyi Ana]|uniref:Uncharacterized protein n=1 Tax=Phormidesmis priestleyi Ana TaxID=1666911 RepID=A0A0N8KNL6_9CYAN|nr:MAG: hypothetical protein HLUCCA11_05150 [Phormidesmis priestleyi Ana]
MSSNDLHEFDEEQIADAEAQIVKQSKKIEFYG